MALHGQSFPQLGSHRPASTVSVMTGNPDFHISAIFYNDLRAENYKSVAKPRKNPAPAA
jgi:hypothetical protein